MLPIVSEGDREPNWRHVQLIMAIVGLSRVSKEPSRLASEAGGGCRQREGKGADEVRKASGRTQPLTHARKQTSAGTRVKQDNC